MPTPRPPPRRPRYVRRPAELLLSPTAPPLPPAETGLAQAIATAPPPPRHRRRNPRRPAPRPPKPELPPVPPPHTTNRRRPEAADRHAEATTGIAAHTDRTVAPLLKPGEPGPNRRCRLRTCGFPGRCRRAAIVVPLPEPPPGPGGNGTPPKRHRAGATTAAAAPPPAPPPARTWEGRAAPATDAPPPTPPPPPPAARTPAAFG